MEQANTPEEVAACELLKARIDEAGFDRNRPSCDLVISKAPPVNGIILDRKRPHCLGVGGVGLIFRRIFFIKWIDSVTPGVLSPRVLFVPFSLASASSSAKHSSISTEGGGAAVLALSAAIYSATTSALKMWGCNSVARGRSLNCPVSARLMASSSVDFPHSLLPTRILSSRLSAMSAVRRQR